MKIQFRQPRVFTFLLTLLLLGGVANHAWAKVTYHILSLPMTTKQLNGDNHQAGTLVDFRTNVRVEVLRCVSNTLTVGLPNEYKSPLVTTYHYYPSDKIHKSDATQQLYGYNNTTYYFYTIIGSTGNYGDNTTNADYANDQLTPGAACSDNIDIYVTYDYDNASSPIDLSTTMDNDTRLLSSDYKEYNIHLKDRMVVLNQKRQNRPGAVLDGQYDSPQLASDAFSWITSAGIGNGDGYRHFIFRFGGNDPYNVTIYTAYDKNTTFRQTGQDNFFTTDVKDKDKYLRKDVFKEYRGASFFRLMSANMDDKNMWLSSDADIQWQEGGARDNAVRKVVPGYYKGPNDNKSTLYEMSPIFNSFAILNHKSGEGWTLAGSKMNTGSNEWQPSTSGQIQYMDYRDNGNNITVIYKADASACKVDVYEVKKYIFRVKTPFGSNVDATIKWSDYAKDESITTSLIPDELRRKYTSFTGNFYADAEHNTAVTTFKEAQTKCSKDEDGKYVIYVDYTVLSSLPFTAITSANRTTGYTTATWYQMTDKDSSGKKIKWDATNPVFKNNGDAKDYTLESDFAFIGDPYELRIINRKLTVDNRGNVFVGSSSRTTNDDLTILNDPGDGTEGEGFKWEIPYDAISGNFVLREFKSSNAYWNWDTGEGNNIKYSTSASTRIKVLELPKIKYVYHIINSAGNEAVKATESQDVGIQLQYSSIPEIIRSPFIHPTLLGGESKITYYYTLDDAKAKTNPQTNASFTPATQGYDIFVRYDLSTMNSTYAAYIAGSTSFNVRLNGQYIYYDSGTIKSTASIVDSDEDGDTNDETAYQWILGGGDPYAMTIQNVGNSNKYISVSDWATGTISWSESAPASKFIIKATSSASVYEVMAATGDGTDAATTYYNIGRADANTVKVYSNGTYAHGYSQLRFQLTPLTAHNVTYHLIDIAGTDLIQVTTRHADADAPYFPDDYRSPLVATYHYYSDSECSSSITKVGSNTAIYVKYTTGTDYDLQNKKIMYLLKYEMGTPFKAENGSDGLEEEAVTPIYPYCNGDCNFFVYGQEQFDIQQQGAASTRTRWAWFLESANNDPYHVKICSRQTETYNGDQTRAYFHTYKPSDYASVVTTLTWPGISGVAGTEYMVLGSTGQFRLLTTDKVDVNGDGDTSDAEDVRCTVNSFEQYWKTWDTVRKKVLGDKDAVAKQSDPNTVPETPATTVATKEDKNNRTYLIDVMGWHSYEQWAYAKRWNGYNISGKTSKGWENIEHWYQTVQMGEGYFDLVPITIDPALILLDQHGWEIMRKPLPSSEDDPELETKHAALRVYDSPMVKEYHFWTKASKRSGFHQYYSLSQRVSTSEGNYSSTSLGSLPPINATNVKDSKGNVYDQYVTYVVKDEYVQVVKEEEEDITYEPFLIQQGTKYASYDGSTLSTNDLSLGGMSKYIIDNSASMPNNVLWYVKPNTTIDYEMGYVDADAENDIATNHDWTNDYTVTDFSESGFDPYNIQISSVKSNTKYFVTNASTGSISEGVWEGNGSTVSLDAVSTRFTATGHDSRSMPVTNATFMAVQDENGNMQLMPRFDQTRRMKDFTTLTTATDADDTHTRLYRPLVYNYMIIDNEGNESLRYQSGGDLTPQTPEWFKSQLAKDFKYYKTAPTYDSENKTLTISDEITEESSLAGAGLTTAGSAGNDVYVRYSYDEDADVDKVLQGKWLTMTLNGKDAVYSEGLKQASIRPEPVDASHKEWQWKFLATPQSTPDPYAVSIYNRSQNGTVTTVSEKTKFALLNYYNAGTKDPNIYTFAVAGTQSYDYDFVNGASMTSDVAATIATEADVKGTSCSYNGTKAQVVLTDDVEHTYTYTIYTNGRVAAVSAEQDNATAVDNGYVPTLPDEIKSPLLNTDQFRYYEALTDTAVNSGKKLNYLYGLYNDIVYVRYNGYDPLTTEYKVPNVKTVVDSKVARDNRSNDAALDISGDLIYNIIWYDDNIMKNGDGDAISKDPSHTLDGTAPYVWQFEGNDPYAIKIKHQSSGKYAVGSSDLAASATSTFMLLPASDSWQYGVLQVTGTSGDNAGKKLTDYGETLTADASTNPTKFIIFGLSTNNVIYHLVIAKTCPDKTVVPLPTDQYVDIPYSEKDEEGNWVEGYSPTDNKTKRIYGSTCRDLTSKKDDDEEKPAGSKYQLGETKSINSSNVTYCVDQGHITLGDSLKVPEALLRPNCKYFYYVGGIYTDNTCATPASSSDATPVTLDSKYKGLQVKYMGKDPDLLGKTVVINVEYQFDDGLPTNNGSDFVTNTSGTQWYTFETSDATPYLAHYTYKDAKLTGVEGRVGHYTNDFLWSPVGDPYGFKMYNRYVYKNGGETTNVMTTASIAANQNFVMGATASNAGRDIYELLPSSTDGYFKVQTLTAQGGTPYYIDNTSGTMQLKSSTTSEWTFSLSDALLEPYYLGAGNVGGLTTTVKEGTTKTKSGKKLYEEATTLIKKQEVVFDADNIVDFTPGYYRIFSEPNSLNITIPRYLSGYTHKTELDVNHDGNEADAIPMHFYEKEGVTTTFDVLGSGFTSTAATRGQIPIVAPEYDPASIFYISGSGPYTMQTQGLYVKENKMTDNSAQATSFEVVDIGGAVVLLRDNSYPDKKYLHYKQTGNIYDVKFEPHGTFDDDDASKWCMEPANKKGLWIETHSGGEEEVLTTTWYYSSYCVPFDMLIQNKDEDDGDGKGVHSSNAYTCIESESPWPGTTEEARKGLHPKPIGKYNAEPYQDNDYFVPAGTPVIFSTKRATEYIKATIPTTTPSTPIPTIFSARYLEQIISDTYDDNKRVYVFGPKMEGTFEINSDGTVNAIQPSLGNTNVGFHLNANQNKEAGLAKASWTRNNYYVLHNRIYYKADGSGASPAPAKNRAAEFVPVIFDDDEEQQELNPNGTMEGVGDGCIYDLMGRKVATREQVEDGSWWNQATPGVYILNGRKVIKK